MRKEHILNEEKDEEGVIIQNRRGYVQVKCYREKNDCCYEFEKLKKFTHTHRHLDPLK